MEELVPLYIQKPVQSSTKATEYTSDTAEDPDETAEGSTKQIQELPRLKTGRLLLIGAELDAQVQEYIKQTRKCGLAVNTSVVIAAASGIIMSHDENQLAENGGGIKLTDA